MNDLAEVVVEKAWLQGAGTGKWIESFMKVSGTFAESESQLCKDCGFDATIVGHRENRPGIPFAWWLQGASRAAIRALLWLYLLSVSSSIAAQDMVGRDSAAEPSIASSLSKILGEEPFSQSAYGVCLSTRALDSRSRFAALRRHVLRGEGRIRLDFELTPDEPWSAVEQSDTPERHESGGQLISPVLDLIDVAAEIGELDHLYQEIETAKMSGMNDRLNRSAVLILIWQHRNEPEKVFQELDVFVKLSAELPPIQRPDCAPELLVLERLLPDAAFSEVALPLLEGLIHRYRSDHDKDSRIIRSRRLLLPHNQHNDSVSLSSASHWHSATSVSARTRGMGLPDAVWRLSAGRAENIVSHGDDFLYFRSPLTGSYQLECDATAFSWQETRLFANGIWVSPIYDFHNYEIGDLNSDMQRRPFEQPLTRTHDDLHLRTAIESGTFSAFVNGRKIVAMQLPAGADPWAGVRSGHNVEGMAKNVRITGTPEIPEQIAITKAESLSGWRDYYESPPEKAVWRKTPDGLTGRRDPALSNVETPCFAEQALFYHRPMFEDGTIEYDFFWQEGNPAAALPSACAHPALDRLCLLLRPEGIAEHWLTDGIFSRIELEPGNNQFRKEHQRHNGRLPLRNQEWNQVSVSLVGNTLRLTVNSELVYERPIDSIPTRRFGFFYFSDQEELQIRSVQWKGTWPKTLPSVAEQPLATVEGQFSSDNDVQLADVFQHDFEKDEFSEEKIILISGQPGREFETHENGLRASAEGEGGYRNTTLAPALQIHGDFDVVARYDELRTSPPIKGSASIMLIAILDNLTLDEAFITRRDMFHSTTDRPQLMQCATVRKTAEGEKRDYFATKPMEETSGCLRLSRRGNQMYYLSAEGDSPNFRLRGTREVATVPVQMNGIRLVNQIHGTGSSDVVWKRLEIRAEKIITESSAVPDPRITELNEQRGRLAVHIRCDWVHQAPDTTLTYRWGDVLESTESPGGLRIRAAGSLNWTSSGILLLPALSGDFDISARFEIQSLAAPASGQGTGVFLQMDGADELQSQISAIFSLADSGTTEFAGQVRRNNAEGRPTYQNAGRFRSQDACSLRIARRGKIITILGRQSPEAPERIVSRFEYHNHRMSNAKILLHTGGPDRMSACVVRDMEIHAEELEFPVRQEVAE